MMTLGSVPPESFNHLLLALRDAAMAIKPAREEANSSDLTPEPCRSRYLISPDRSPVAKIRADAGFRLTQACISTDFCDWRTIW
jgi:hypothetical protein